MIQPTHASSRVGGLPSDAVGAPFFRRERVEEMKAILDHLTQIERRAPAVAGRMDHSRIGAVRRPCRRAPALDPDDAEPDRLR